MTEHDTTKSYRLRLRWRGRKVAEMWQLDEATATRLTSSEPAYEQATAMLGLGRKRRQAATKPTTGHHKPQAGR